MADAGAQDDLTIDELARETGMTTRTIRAHQSRGLLPPPSVRARTGYYGRAHARRIRLIQEMQGEGFNLTAIQRLLQASNGAGEEAFDFRRALLSAFAEELPEYVSAGELQTRLGGPADAKTLRKAEKLGLVRPLPDGRYEIPSPTLLRAGEELVALGIPLAHALAVGEQIQRHSRAIAEAFVRLFLQDVVGSRDVKVTERSAEEWVRLREALERLRPLASEAVRASFQLAMSDVVERALEKTLRTG